MAHNYNDNGTIYEVGGGKLNDNGSLYEVAYGKYNDNGTVYEIAFAEPITVTINPYNYTYNPSLCHVKYNGVVYTAKTILEINKGDTLVLYASGSSMGAYISIDGQWVVSGPGTYNYVPQGNVKIEFESGKVLGSNWGAVKVTST